jgi:hypothetical protein
MADYPAALADLGLLIVLASNTVMLVHLVLRRNSPLEKRVATLESKMARVESSLDEIPSKLNDVEMLVKSSLHGNSERQDQLEAWMIEENEHLRDLIGSVRILSQEFRELTALLKSITKNGTAK